MPVTIVPAATFYGSGGASSEGHSHTNSATLNKLSTDNNGNLCFNGRIVGEKAIETSCNFSLTDSQARQKFIALPDDCDTARAIILSLNGVSFAQGDFWEVRENVNTACSDLIAWEGLGLENIAQAGDKVIISYYKNI
ncbi:MAG: hypothetical protein IJG39_10195 [Synergistaceae bacterium]|nr:hypothetical protein [Synergistaceae bacterium]